MDRRARRALWWALRIVVAVLALLVLVPVLLLLALRTEWGGSVARDLALPRINDTLAGRLEVADFRFRGRSLELRQVVLRDPEGGKVVELGRAWVAFSPLALLRRHIDLREVVLEQPVVTLERDRRGWNLTRALAPRRPPAPPVPVVPARKQAGSPLHLAVHKLTLSGGVLQLREAAPAELPPLYLERLDSEGRVDLVLGHGPEGGRVQGHLRLQGATLAPVRAPLELAVSAEAVGPRGAGSFHFAWGGTRLDLSMRSRDWRDLRVAIDGLRVEPSLVRRFVPAYPLRTVLQGQGTASLRGDALDAQLALSGPGLRARLQAQADVARSVAQRVHLEAREVDLSQLVAGGPPSRFDLLLEGRGGGRSLAEAQGQADLRVLPGAQIAGRPFGPVRARVHADEGRYRLEELIAVLPGLRVTGRGASDGRALDIEAQVAADDLGLAARSLGVPPRLGVAGRGQLTATVGGTVQRPELRARAQAPTLRVAGTAVEGLRLVVRSEGTGLPLSAAADAQVGSLRSGGRRFSRVALSARSARSGAFSLDASTATPTRLSLQAAGRAHRRGQEGATVDLARLRVAYPQATWQLADRARIEVGPRALAVSGLDLRAQPRGGSEQRLRADLRQRGRFIEGRVELAGLDLAGLPPGLLPPGRQLGGRASATVQVRGRLPAPEVDLQAALADGRVDRHTGLQLDLTARNQPADGITARLRLHQRGQALAELDARVGATLADFQARRELMSTPLTVQARVGPLRLQRVGLPIGAVGAASGERPVFQARAQAQLAARGTLGDPTVELRAAIDQARLGQKALGQAQLRFDYQDARPTLQAKVDSANGGRLELDLQAQADLSPPALRRGLPIRAVPIQGRLASRALDLSILSGLHDTVRAVAGLLEADGRIEGNLGAPHLAGKLSWKQGRLVLAGLGEYRDIDLALRGDPREMVLEHLHASSGSGRADLSGRAVREGDGRQLALEARARLDRFRFYTEGQALGALSLESTAKGTVAPERIAIAVQIPEAHFELAGEKRKKVQSLKRPEDIVILENGQPIDAREAKKLRESLAAAAGPAGEKSERRVRVSVEGDRNLWVRGPDVNLELGAEPGLVMIASDEPRLFGTVKVRRGFVKVLGRRFEITGGSSLVFGGPLDRPTLSVDATYRAEQAATTVAVHVEGPADRLSFTLRSPEHPEYGDTELLTLVLTGRLPEEISRPGGGAAPADQAASLLGGLLAAQVQKALARRLPLDVLLFDPGQNMEGARLEAGTYLGDDLYVAYIGRTGTDPFLRENRNEVHLEWQLGSRWSLEGTYGDARRGSADLIWSKTY
jgi:autotransporter translocation and assembly factor TamB